MRTFALLVFGVLLAAHGSHAARAEGLPYPAGPSSHRIEGLQTELALPKDLSTEHRGSLVVILHGAGGTATGMAGALSDWSKHRYVVCAPKSTGQVWSDPDVEAVKRIAAHLLKVLPLDPEKVHVVGFSNGGWNLPPLAFDERLRPVSATWVAAGCQGGSVPESQKNRLGVLALAGAQDANLGAARDTVKVLAGKVKSVEVRVQPDLGHAWPDALMPYLLWWMGVQEGRFTSGDDRSFDWKADLAAAKAAVAGKKKGGVLFWVYDPADVKPEAKALQHETFFDPEVRRLGAQLQAVKRERAQLSPQEVAELGLTTTPFLAVFDAKGALKQSLEGKVKAAALAKALRSVAPEPREPK